MVKKVADNTFKYKIFSKLHKYNADMVNRKMGSLQENSAASLEKIQLIYILHKLRKKLESSTNHQLEIIKNTRNKTVQPNLSHI